MSIQGYIRFPTIYGDRIVFTAEDDLWTVTTGGGRADRLTAGVALASNSKFSPDGSLIAFTGQDEGPSEVYVMDAGGSPARRLTFQGDRAQVAGWLLDGSGIIYATSAGQADRRGLEVLMSISPSGGEPRTLPYGVAHSIAYGPNGSVVIGRNTAEPARWKRYRGGTAGYLWIDREGNGQFERLLNLDSNISYPCWVGERIYFISDHEGIGNVYSCNPSGQDIRRHTNQTEFYARGLASDGRTLVYHSGGDLYLLDPEGTEGRKLDVELPTSRAQVARRFAPADKYLESWALRNNGSALTVTSRGKAFSMGNWDGAVLQHGAADGVRYRLARWFSDNKRVVAISDNGTEPRLVIFHPDGSAEDSVLDSVDIGHVFDMRASPQGETVLLQNHRNEVMLVNLADGSSKVVDRSEHGRAWGIAWSPDSAWVAYSLAINPQQSVIKLCRVESGETWQVTEPVLKDANPAFDPGGKYLYFISAREFDPVFDQLQFELSFAKGTRPYLVTLQRDQQSPFVPGPESPEEAEGETPDKDKGDEKKAAPEPVRIDLEGISSRIVPFPVPEGRYERVQGTEKGVVFSSVPVEGTRHGSLWDTAPEAKGSLDFYSFETHKQDRLIEGLTDFDVTPDGKSLIYRAGNRLRVVKAGGKPQGEDLPAEEHDKPGRETGWVDLDRVRVSVLPSAEWKQMFDEAWRLQREHFWVADMGGVDWQEVHDRYAPLVERVGSRGELSDLFWEMQGELGSSHAYEVGGEYREHPQYPQGFLGVDWEYDADSQAYRIARIVHGDPWNPAYTSPLLAPGVNVSVGDSVIAINGQRVTPERGPQQLLVNHADSEVQLLIRPAGGEPRSVTVKALGDEHPARYRDWVEGNRRKVHEATNDRVGYLHIPDMGADGFAEFHRYYLAEYDHEGLIVDLRRNGGGMVSGLLLQRLTRPRLGYDFQRWGAPEPYFSESPRGSLVAVTDENAGSDGDIFSHAWKMLNLGPLIGKRTWGGVIGISPMLPLADQTITTQPEFSFWFNDVGWGVENYGTDPTIDVDYPPQAYVAGEDPQLDRAIQEALRLIEENPSQTPVPEPHPNRGVKVKA